MKFKYKTKVKIINGFYEGQRGVILDYYEVRSFTGHTLYYGVDIPSFDDESTMIVRVEENEMELDNGI